MRLLLLAGLFLLIAGAQAQTVGTNKVPGQPDSYTISVTSQLVVETVVAHDKAGKPIEGLTAKDFTVTEDGAPQTIRFCEYQSLPTTATPLPKTKPEDEKVKIYKRLARTQIAPEAQGNLQYKDHRLLALYFDMTAMRPEEQMRSLAAAEKFIRTQMTSADLVSILRYQGGGVDVLADFTADRNRLLSVLETLTVGEGQNYAETIDDASSADTGAAFGQDDSEFNIFNTDRQLAALQTAAQMLGHLSEKKSLIYFASGLRLNGLNNQAQLRATVDAAIRAGVSFWPIDARGLVASAPLGDATQGSAGNQGLYSGAAAQAMTTNFQISQDTLYSLAGDTGGKALLDNNDLMRGIVQAQEAVTSYYVIGYYTTNTAQNGKFRRVKITIDHPAEAKLEYRQGYYAGKEFKNFNDADRERQLEEAFMLGDPITELTIAMEVNYFQLNRAEYYVPVVVKIPGRELALAKKRGVDHTKIDFLCEVKDLVGGTTVTNVRDTVDIKISDATAQELAHRPIEYDFGFTLMPGKYVIKFLARDNETGRIGTYQANFLVPNLNKEEKRVPTSTIVLSSQRVDPNEVLYDTVKQKERTKNDAVNPLVQEGKKLIPSVTRVFSKGKDLYVYLQAYEQGETAAKPMVAFISFYRDHAKVFETKPMAVTPSNVTRLGMTPINFTLGLDALPPGEYQVQVSVIDPTDGKGSFWQAPIMVVP